MKKNIRKLVLAAFITVSAFLPVCPVMAEKSTGNSMDISTPALTVTDTSTEVVMNESTTIRISACQEGDRITYNNEEIRNGGTLPRSGYFFLHSVSKVERSSYAYTEYVLDAEPIYAVCFSVDSNICAPLETAYYLAGTTADLPVPVLLPAQENTAFAGWLDKTGSIVSSLTLQEDTTLYASFSVPGDLRKIAAVRVNPFPNSTRLEEITDSLPGTTALVLDNGSTVQASINWTAESTYDPALTAEQDITFRGDITLPDNITNSTGMETSIRTTVTVYEAGTSTYTLTYDLNGGSGDIPSPSSYQAGERVMLCPSAAKPCSRFLGWSTTPDSSYANAGSVSMTMPSHDVVLYAIYADEDPCLISFDMGESRTAPPEPVTVYRNETAILPFNIIPEEKNHIFAGWAATPDAKVPAFSPGSNASLSVEEDTTLYAVYETVKDVSVTYDLNGGTGTAPADDTIYRAGDTVSVRFLMPAREGHTFLGWSMQEYARAADFRTDGNTAFTMPNHDVTLYAVWRSNTSYTVVYDLNGGTGECPADPGKYYAGDEVQILFSPAPQKPDAVFTGWSSSPSAAAPAFSDTGTSIFKMGTSDVVLYAVYQEASYLTLQYDANGGTNAPVDSSHYHAGNKVTLNFTDLPVRHAHRFLGWAESPDASVPDYSVQSLTSFTVLPGASLKVLYAVWDTEEPKHITYDLNGIQAERTPADGTLYYKGDTASLDFSIVPKDTEYVFKGWAKTKDAFEPYYTASGKNSLLIASEDITLYAVYERSTDIDGAVKITYSPGTGCLKAVYEPGRKKPSGLKYTWMSDGKTLSAGAGSSYTPQRPGDYRVLLSDSSGRYTGSIDSGTIKLHKVSGSTSVELDNPAGIYAEGNLVNARARISPDSTVFREWSADGISLSSSQKKGNPLSFTMGAKDVVLSYSTSRLYTLKVSGGAADTYSCTEGTKVSLRASSVSGHSFEKWIISGGVSLSDITSPHATFTMPAANVTVSAVFKPDQPEKNGTEQEKEKKDGSADSEPLIFTVLCDGGIENADIKVIHHKQGPLCEAVFRFAKDGFTIYGDYYNITVMDSAPPVYETEQKIKLQIAIPASLQKSGRTFRMICVSRFGIPYTYEDLDSNDETITIETDRFYAYALCYSDEWEPQNEPIQEQNEPDRMVSELHDAAESGTLDMLPVSVMHASEKSQTRFPDADCIAYTMTEKAAAIENAADTLVTYHSM